MNAYPIQVTLIDSSHSPGGSVELGMLSTDFPDDPPQGINICNVSWVRSSPARESAETREPSDHSSVRYRSTTPITWLFLHYLDHVLNYPYAARKLSVQPIVPFAVAGRS